MENLIIRSFLKSNGIVHRVTSSYRPQANGLVERTQRTLINALRKYSETDQNSWPKWLDWVLYAYRTRIHTTTQQSPFFLMFGRKPNSFGDWSTKNLGTDELELMNRGTEIKTLSEKIHAETINNIKEKQIVQQNVQNMHNNVRETQLERGTMVMVRNDDKLVKKLDPRFRGPYEVVEKTEGNNYRLKDVTGKLYPDNLPLDKLKIVKLTNTNKFFEVERILTHRIKDGKPE